MTKEIHRDEEYLVNPIYDYETFVAQFNNMPLCFLDYAGEFREAWYHRSDDLHPAFNLLKEQKIGFVE